MPRRLNVLLGAFLSVVAAVCLGVISEQRGESVNSIWIVLAAASFFTLGYRFYAKFIAAKVMALDDRRATPAERLHDGHDYEPTNKWILFGHRRTGSLGGAHARRAVWLSPGPAVDSNRVRACRCGPGLRYSVLLDAAQWANAGTDGAGRDRESGRLCGARYGAADHGDPARGGGLGGCECAEGKSMGHVHNRRHDAGGAVYGALPAFLAARQSAGVFADRLRAGDAQHF